MIRPLFRPAFIAALLATLVLPVTAQETTAPAPVVSTLPGGASSLTEQHGDWTVSCGMTQQGKDCILGQALGNAQTGQRALSVELRTIDANKVEGMLLTPFSLRLDGGINLAVDERPLLGPLPFLACIEVGCLVPVVFEGDALAALRSGTSLEFAAIPLNGGEPVRLALSLRGFTAASARTSELSR